MSVLWSSCARRRAKILRRRELRPDRPSETVNKQNSGLLSPDLAAGIRRGKGAKKLACRLGNWLTAEEARMLWQLPNPATLKGNEIEQFSRCSSVADCGVGS